MKQGAARLQPADCRTDARDLSPRRDTRGANIAVKDGALTAALKHREREVVEKALAEAHGNVADAAARMGVLRTSLYRIMKRYSIAVPSRSRN